MTFQEYSLHSRNLIEENLKSFLHTQHEEEIPQILQRQDVIGSLEEFVFKGKLIRGTLFFLTIELLGGKISKEHIDIACAIELIHSSLLIQDDIIDNDRVRRGGKTIFAVYEEKGKDIKAFDSRHYGISIAILVADVATYLAMELISNFKDRSVGSLLKYFSREIKIVALAEGIDSELGQTLQEATKDEIYAVYKYKTARYTFSLPFVMGCIVMQAGENIKKEFEELGECVGTIFQIKDDMLGLLGDEAIIGKPVGSDVRENKKTLIRSLLYEKTDNIEKELLDSSFGNVDLTDKQLNSIKDLVAKHQIVSELDKDIDKIMEKAWVIFEEVDGIKEYKNILKSLLEFNLQRKA